MAMITTIVAMTIETSISWLKLRFDDSAEWEEGLMVGVWVGIRVGVGEGCDVGV